MADIKEIVKLALDVHNGSVKKYSQDEATDILRQALIDANGGSTKIDIRRVRDGKCGEVFAIVEEILRNTVPQGLQENDFFTALVDFRNVAEGDEKSFDVEDTDLFFVDDIAKGTQGLRRQRIAGTETILVPTKVHGIRIYEELSRILAGRADFNALISKVDRSVQNEILSEVYTTWKGVTSTDLGGAVYFPTVGSYSEATLLTTIDHVEAAAGGKIATIIGTKAALRPIAANISHEGNDVKGDMYAMGYIGRFFGSPVVVVPQRHKVGTTTFEFDNDVVTIVAGDEKPVKFVYEGDPLIIPGDPTNNADLTQEYFLAEQWGIAYASAGNSGIGKYQFTA